MLKIEHLSFKTNDANQKEILNDINLNFEKNKIYCITGPNGGGKTTLVKSIMGLNNSSGKIVLDDQDISALSIDQRARLGISFAFQKPITFKGIKVRKLLNLASGKENNVGQICDYLSAVGLCAKDYIDRYFDDKLSGGEQKRIELALLLAKGGKVNIFDEPEAGIDLWSFEKLIDVISSIKDSIIIIVSHQRKILEVADKVILLKEGKVEAEGSYAQLAPYLNQNTCAQLNN